MNRLAMIAGVVSVFSLAACAAGSTGDSETESAAGAQSRADTVVATGDYRLDDTSRSGTLSVTRADAKSISFSLSIVNNFGGFNMGDLEGAQAKKVGDIFVYERSDEDCRVELKPTAAATLEVEQTGTCQFGLNVHATGTYKKGLAEPAPPVAPGTYGLDNEARAGSIIVKRATVAEIEFDLSVVNKFGGFNMGDLEGALATRSVDGSYVFDDTELDCLLTLEIPGPDTIKVVDQSGTCGFGHNVIATGDYAKE